ncbi:MAG: tetratricopeptide repeat protein [Bdellovibrionaceae bacterium]|nr:tetratricopeptide repeat protein [Pseudobdellovibrionaceae bacterium]
MRWLICLPLFVLLSACGSAPRQEPSRVVVTEESPNQKDHLPRTQQAPQTMQAPTSAAASGDPQPKEKTIEQQFAEALRSQDQAAIERIAAQLLMGNPRHTKALNALGLLNYRRGKFKMAEYFLRRAIASSPNQAELHANLGMVLLANGEEYEAIKLLRRAFDLDANNPHIAANLGSIYVKHGDWNKAAVVLETAVSRGLNDYRILNNYALALTGQGKHQKAGEYYLRAMKDQSNRKELMLNYAIHLVEHQKKPAEALDLINRIKFLGVPAGSRELINDLENRAKAIQ